MLVADGDPVGLAAAHRAAQRYGASGRRIRLVELPPGMDANDVLRREAGCGMSATRLKDMIDEAPEVEIEPPRPLQRPLEPADQVPDGSLGQRPWRCRPGDRRSGAVS